MVVDLTVTSLIFGLQFSLWYIYVETPDKYFTPQRFLINLLPPILVTVFSLILALSAIYIAKLVKQSTGRQQNTFLLVWHFINLLLFITVLASYAILERLYNSSLDDGQASWRYLYYTYINDLATLIIGIYVDLFLLWLLYRFMKPERFLQDGRTEACALLFVHDA